MDNDLRVPVGDGAFWHRAGAIILRDGAILMASNNLNDYYYTVGGAVKLHETARSAVARECREELDDDFADGMTVSGLRFVQENFFNTDSSNPAKQTADNPHPFIHEIVFYFVVEPADSWQLPASQQPAPGHGAEISHPAAPVTEYYEWIPLPKLASVKAFPTFFATELAKPWTGIRHIVQVEVDDVRR
jgi:ADP-ribose pyrophosphatase YjhB (NUDIX family)